MSLGSKFICGLVATAAFVSSCGSGESESAAPVDPILSALGMGDSADLIAQSNFEIRVLQQEHIANCMRESGFEYELVPVEEVEPVEPSNNLGGSRRSDDGYGFTTDAEGYLASFQTAHGENPNEAIVRRLSATEIQAYNNAFVGEDGNGGCVDEALVATNPLYRFSLEFGPDMQVVDADIRSDPRVVDSAGAWSECMSNQGFRYDEPSEPVSEFESELQDWFATHAPGSQIAATGDVIVDSTPEGREALDLLAASERATAVADDRCATDYWSIFDQVSAEKTTEMLTRNEDRLRRIVELGGDTG